jgi:hypothetical protein
MVDESSVVLAQGGQGMGMPMGGQHGSSIIRLTNPERVLERVELDLRRQRKNEFGEAVLMGEPLCNEVGVSAMLGHAHSLVNQVTVLSNFSKRDVMIMMQHFSDAVIIDLMCNRLKYGVLEPSNVSRTTILAILTNACYPVVKRAFEGDDKRFWKGSTHEYTARIDAQDKGGWLSKLPFMGQKA